MGAGFPPWWDVSPIQLSNSVHEAPSSRARAECPQVSATSGPSHGVELIAGRSCEVFGHQTRCPTTVQSAEQEAERSFRDQDTSYQWIMLTTPCHWLFITSWKNKNTWWIPYRRTLMVNTYLCLLRRGQGALEGFSHYPLDLYAGAVLHAHWLVPLDCMVRLGGVEPGQLILTHVQRRRGANELGPKMACNQRSLCDCRSGAADTHV